MNSSFANQLRNVALIAGGAAVAGAALVWFVRRQRVAQVGPESLAPSPNISEDFEEPSPNSFSFEPEEVAPASVTARPSARPLGVASADDYGALSPDDLGAAFLAAATDTSHDEPPPSTSELVGFQIYDRDGIDSPLVDDEDADLSEIFDRVGRAGGDTDIASR